MARPNNGKKTVSALSRAVVVYQVYKQVMWKKKIAQKDGRESFLLSPASGIGIITSAILNWWIQTFKRSWTTPKSLIFVIEAFPWLQKSPHFITQCLYCHHITGFDEMMWTKTKPNQFNPNQKLLYFGELKVINCKNPSCHTMTEYFVCIDGGLWIGRREMVLWKAAEWFWWDRW